MAADDDDPDSVPARTIDVRETRTLCYACRPWPQISAVPARSPSSQPTLRRSREIAAKHDALRPGLRDPIYAVCESLDTTERHVFGDVIFRSEPCRPKAGGAFRKAFEVERARSQFVFGP
jgi:hypothetical protein